MTGPVGIEPFVGPPPAGRGSSGGVFITNWDTTRTSAGSSASDQIALPLESTGTYDFTVHWGDGSSDHVTAWDAAAATHTYEAAGTYRVSITGSINGWRFGNAGDLLKITEILSWGPLRLGNNGGYFWNCANLQVTAVDAPNLSETTSLSRMFQGCSALNADFSSWDTSGVNDMSVMFLNATIFNGDITTWDVSNVTNMAVMFQGAEAFNQDISGWDTVSLVSAGSMFRTAKSFNQPIGRWDVSKVTAMDYMFYGAFDFNQPLSSRLRRCAYVSNTSVYASGSNIGDGTAVTVAFRIRLANTTDQTIVSKMDAAGTAPQWEIGVASGMLYIAQYQTTGSLYRGLYAGTVTAGEWFDAVVSLTSAAMNVKQGTTEYSQTTSAATWNTSGGMLRLGAPADGVSGGGFNGRIKDLAIAETDLWSERATLLDDPSNALAHYPFEEESGTFAYNRLSSAHRLTWTGATLTTLHFVDSAVAKSWANDSGYSEALLMTGSGAGAAWDSSNTWLADTPVSGDFQVDWYFDSVISSNAIFGLQLEPTVTASETTYAIVDFGVQWVGANTLRFRENNTPTDVSASLGIGDVLSFRRSGSEVSAYINGSLVHTFSATTTADLYGVVAFHVTSIPALVLAHYDGEPIRFGHLGTSLTIQDAIIPQVDGTATDALGNPATFASGDETPKWDTSSVATMQSMFESAAKFNQPLDSWDISGVTRIDTMFANAAAFNQDLNRWDTSAVNNMYRTFYNAAAFNGDITSWDTSANLSIREMFAGCSAFNQPIGGWNVSKVTSMFAAFLNASAFNQSLNSWNVSSVISIGSMFSGASAFNGNIASWNPTSATTMESMFRDASTFNQDIGGWNVSSVTDMSYMFRNAAAFNQDLDLWDVSSVAAMLQMFFGASSFNGNVSTWTTTACTTMEQMFTACAAFNGDVNSWDTQNVTSMAAMFQSCTAFAGSIANWNTGACTDMNRMFQHATAFNSVMSAWNVSKVTSMENMFYNAPSFNQSLQWWNTGSVTTMSGMFYGATSFNGYVDHWDTAACTDMRNMFYGAAAFNQSLTDWSFGNVADMTNFMVGTNFSTTRYNQLLGILSISPTLQSNVTLDMGTTKYTSGTPGTNRQSIIDTYNWTINDGGATP